MNDLGYGEHSNPNRSLFLLLIRVRNHCGHYDIFTTMTMDLPASQSLSQSTLIFRLDEPSLTTQSPSRIFMSYLVYDILEIPWKGIHKIFGK